ncbi:TIGR03758 family integrating conjugative element protein [Salinicola sp. JS01]|uniref:TIGR03758 family integrating conjugative element protein n=1 Tax=Salinicola sp. JS01 TaxID=3050071 RepID=UPI00255BF613|nr:TIGR03758 family integrating conjugative element protein [Salinicola sp. JS01]WIX33243.1 TIGR03758 family integrating conjugative element protein [Salinicola sp. JS01]
MAVSTSSAFEAGAGASPDTVYLLIASVGCALAILWLTWLTISAWRGWTGGRFGEWIMTWSFIRGVMVVVILFWLLLR